MDAESSKWIVEVAGVSKTYETASGSFEALRDLNFRVARGEFVGIFGKSGSGKSTLMNVLTGIDRPTKGEVRVGYQNLNDLNERKMSLWRGKTVGVVFQFFQLLPTLTVAENVMLPMDFCNTYPSGERFDRAHQLLERVGIADQARKLPSTLSGGQQQRAAIARALANDPKILAADEPTGNLDTATSDAVLGLFASLVREGKTVIMVTHERDVERFLTRELHLNDGVLV